MGTKVFLAKRMFLNKVNEYDHAAMSTHVDIEIERGKKKSDWIDSEWAISDGECRRFHLSANTYSEGRKKGIASLKRANKKTQKVIQFLENYIYANIQLIKFLEEEDS